MGTGDKEMATLEQSFNEFLSERGGRKSQRTRDLYQERLHTFMCQYRHMSPADITGAQIGDWLDILERRGYSPATMSGYRQSIKTLFQWCVRRGIIDHSPAANLRIGSFISRRRKLPNPTHLDLAVAVARQWTMSSDMRQVRDAAIFLLSCACGPRCRELRQLRLSEVRRALQAGPDSNGVFTAASYGKSGETLMRFTTDVAQAIQRWLTMRPPAGIDVCFITTRQVAGTGDESLRFRPLARRSLDGAFERISQAAGVPTIRSHAIRHHVGDLVTRTYGPKVAAMILNHRDIDSAATAIAYYHHPNQADVSRAIRGLDSAEHDPLNALFTARR